MRTESLITITKMTVQASILCNTKNGYIGWSSCDRICMDMQDCLDMCEAALLTEVYSDVLEAAIYILASSIKLASHADSSSGMLSDVIMRTFKLIEKCTKKIAQHEKLKRDQALNSILKEVVKNYFDGWGNWRYDLLKCGIRLCDEKSATKLERLLDDLETNLEEPFYSEYIKEEESIVR